MMKDKQEEGKQQSTKTTARNSRASKHTHTHTHTHQRSSQGRYVYNQQQQPEQVSKQESTGRQVGKQ